MIFIAYKGRSFGLFLLTFLSSRRPTRGSTEEIVKPSLITFESEFEPENNTAEPAPPVVFEYEGIFWAR